MNVVSPEVIATLLNAIVDEVLSNNIYITGLTKKYKYFALRPNERGAYLIKAEYRTCLEQFTALQAYMKCNYVHVDRIHAFLQECTCIEFVPKEDVILFDATDSFILDNYQTDKNVCIQLFIGNIDHTTSFANIMLRLELTQTEQGCLYTSSKPTADQQKFLIGRRPDRERITKILSRGPPPNIDMNKICEGDSDSIEMNLSAEILENIPKVCICCQASTSSKCGRCKLRYYCSISCQRNDWPVHRDECAELCEYGKYLVISASGLFL